MKTTVKRDRHGRPVFTRAMKKTHTILIPNMLPLHFVLLRNIFEQSGYHVELLTNRGRSVVDEGLKYVHNDTCYPALLVIGQIIDALNSGAYDLDRVAVAMTQTGGGCRASNYIHLMRKAFAKAGYGDIPVLSLNISGLERETSLKLTLSMLRKALSAVVYGDMLMLLRNQVMAYECIEGDASRMTEKWLINLDTQLQYRRGLSKKAVRENLVRMAADFASIPVNRVPKVKVGIVGEIYVKFVDLANNGLERFLNQQGCEVNVPGLMGFMLYCIRNVQVDSNLYGGGYWKSALAGVALTYMEGREDLIRQALLPYPEFTGPGGFAALQRLSAQVIGQGAKMGEGWLLPGEMMELIEQGYENIVCTQPFGCLPNHIVGKGVLSRIKGLHPLANIVAIDYDPSATEVNQENRIKLMLAVARENLEGKLHTEAGFAPVCPQSDIVSPGQGIAAEG